MRKTILIVVALTMAVLIAVACSPAPTAVPTQPPPTAAPKPTAAPPQPVATAAPPTPAPAATATAVPPTTAPNAPATTAVATSAPAPVTATSAPPPTAVPSAPPATSPGLYVTNMRLDPAQPAHAQNISFFVSFLNTASGDQNVRWVIFIYKADSPTRPNIQTAVTSQNFQLGGIEVNASPTIKFGGTGNACDFYFARVDLLDINNKATDMTKPDGQVFEKGFSVCQ